MMITEDKALFICIEMYVHKWEKFSRCICAKFGNIWFQKIYSKMIYSRNIRPLGCTIVIETIVVRHGKDIEK